MNQKKITNIRQRRSNRIRARIHGTADRPRISVFKSNVHTSVQLIDDDKGATIVQCSTYVKKTEQKKGTIKEKGIALAQTLGKKLAGAAKEKGITKAVLDRGARKYHGFIKTIAQTMRSNGITI